MNIIARSTKSSDIESSLERCVREVNKELKKVDGRITKAYAEVSLGPSGAYVTIYVAVSGNTPHRKSIIGINQGGKTLERSMELATEKLNEVIAKKEGEVVDVFTKNISTLFSTPLTGKTYTTIIAAINEDDFMPARNAALRRQRIKNTLKLLNNDPKAINISEVAEIFGVSRLIIYKDLEELGFKR